MNNEDQIQVKRIGAIAKVLTWASSSKGALDPWLKSRTAQFAERTGLTAAQALTLMSDVNSQTIDQVEFIKTVDEIVDPEYQSQNYPNPLD